MPIPTPSEPAALVVSNFQWTLREGTEHNPLKLHAVLNIGATSFHVEALQVSYRRGYGSQSSNTAQIIVFAADEELTSQLYDAFGMEGPIETVRIPGVGQDKEYAIFMSPFCT